MRKGAHGHVFCSAIQFKVWYMELRKVTERVENSADDEEEAAETKTTSVF